MGDLLRDAALVSLFILAGGFFAAAEAALVSLRGSQVAELAERGGRSARVAGLAAEPGRALYVARLVGLLATLLAGAVGAVTVADDVVPALTAAGLARGPAEALALLGVTALITCVSLVLGEQAPKRLGLQRALGTALLAAPALDRLAAPARPLIWLLTGATNLVVRSLGGATADGRSGLSAEEVRALVAGSEEITADERRLIGEVFAAGERPLREVLLPRTEVEFLDAALALRDAARLAVGSPHSRFPVYRESHDEVIGFVHVRDLLDPTAAARTAPLAEIVRPVKFLPASTRVLAVLSEMRREGHHLAIVLDEYGGTAGIVTLEDLVEELIGDIRDEYDVKDAQARRLHGGAVEVDGLLNLDAFAAETGARLPEGPYETVAGHIMAALGQVPDVGEAVEVSGHRLEVIEMDGRRVARVRVTPVRREEPNPTVPTRGDTTPDKRGDDPGSGAVASDGA